MRLANPKLDRLPGGAPFGFKGADCSMRNPARTPLSSSRAPKREGSAFSLAAFVAPPSRRQPSPAPRTSVAAQSENVVKTRPQNMKPASTKPRVCLVLTPRGPNTRPGVALRASYELGAGAYPEFITHSEEFGQ